MHHEVLHFRISLRVVLPRIFVLGDWYVVHRLKIYDIVFQAMLNVIIFFFFFILSFFLLLSIIIMVFIYFLIQQVK
jgi:hypothetical protein